MKKLFIIIFLIFFISCGENNKKYPIPVWDVESEIKVIDVFENGFELEWDQAEYTYKYIVYIDFEKNSLEHGSFTNKVVVDYLLRDKNYHVKIVACNKDDICTDNDNTVRVKKLELDISTESDKTPPIWVENGVIEIEQIEPYNNEMFIKVIPPEIISYSSYQPKCDIYLNDYFIFTKLHCDSFTIKDLTKGRDYHLKLSLYNKFGGSEILEKDFTILE